MNKTLLMVAFEFPPSNGASVPRIDSFYRYLKQWGWKVIVLTASPKGYVKIDETYQDKPDDQIYRALSLDVQRQLSFKGKYISAMATPDRWGLTWIPSAIRLGNKLIKAHQPDVIWSSSPIPSTHVIANKLAMKHSIPWVADYRDPFHYMNGTAGKWLDKVHKKIDQTTLKNASHLTFATSAVKDLYQIKYKSLVSEKSTVIENGYDEANFEKLQTLKDKSTPFSDKKFSLYYSGVLYLNGRDPVPVFDAISKLKAQGQISSNDFELVFQGAGNGEDFNKLIGELNIQNMIKFIEPVPFLNALNNMMNANALLLIQDSRFDSQIPGKVYEYLRTGKPILTKAAPEGLTAEEARKHKGTFVCFSENEVTRSLYNLLNSAEHYDRHTDEYKRKYKAKQLEDIILSACKSKAE